MAWMGIWWLVGLAVLILLVWTVVGGARWGLGEHREDSPETILKRRYARGDMDRDEYERRLTDLRK